MRIEKGRIEKRERAMREKENEQIIKGRENKERKSEERKCHAHALAQKLKWTLIGSPYGQSFSYICLASEYKKLVNFTCI